MRNSLILFSFAALVAACSEQQQPTSPAAARSDGSFPVVDGIRVPDLKPTDQVGFTTVEYIESAVWTVTAGQSLQGMALCPAGSMVTGGGFRLNSYAGTTPLVTYSRLIVIGPQYGWSVVLSNKQAGAADATFLVDAVCVH
jgi:hypothetical protein